MRRRMLGSTFMSLFVVFTEVSALKIQNKLLGKCLQAQEGASGTRVSLVDCSPFSVLQDWHWLPESLTLSSQHSGKCLTASEEQYEGVHLKPCFFRAESYDVGAGEAAVDAGRDGNSQTWSCSRKGHLTLKGRGLHLSATQESTLVFLSREHKQQGSRWQALDNETLCNGKDIKHKHYQPRHHPDKQDPGIIPSATSDIHRETQPWMGWKITMLVLSSLALVLGTVIIILNVYSNRRKKVVCVLKSYTPRPELNVPGSPVSSERAPLTQNAMRLPHSSPTLQRGEILIEWKDGTVTPLYEA